MLPKTIKRKKRIELYIVALNVTSLKNGVSISSKIFEVTRKLVKSIDKRTFTITGITWINFILFK